MRLLVSVRSAEEALAAIPRMLSADPTDRAKVLAAIRQVVSSIGAVSGDRAERLAQIEKLFEAVEPTESGAGKID